MGFKGLNGFERNGQISDARRRGDLVEPERAPYFVKHY